jgi:hypothetical protein
MRAAYHFQCPRETLFLWSRLVVLLITRGLAGQTIVGIGPLDCASRLVQDCFRLLQERPDLLHELGLVAIFFLPGLHVLEMLQTESIQDKDMSGRPVSSCSAHLADQLAERSDAQIGILN